MIAAYSVAPTLFSLVRIPTFARSAAMACAMSGVFANPVTGKRVTLVVDRYYLAAHGRRAVLDEGTPQGVDNVDAYRLIAQSFRWR